MHRLIPIFLVFAMGSLAIGQTVLEVPADIDGEPVTNALIQYVVADTNESGEQLHDIYKLLRGKTYFYNQSPVFKNPITLVADPPGDTDETKPPQLLITTDDEGGTPYEHCITTFADLTVRNIAFNTTTVEGSYSWANAILLQADDLKIVLEGCHFTLIGWGMIEADVDNTVFILDKCHVRNGTVYDYGDEWVPFFFEINTGTADSLVIRNSTFFNLQGSVINVETQNIINYLELDHNTMANVVKGFTTAIHAHVNSKITNNIFYNVATHSYKIAEIEDGEDQINAGVITVDTLFSNEPGSSLPFVMDESDRSFVLTNNAYFFTPGVEGYWAHYDSVLAVPWLDARAQAMFDDDDSYPNFIDENNVSVDPGFVNFGGTSGMVSQLYNHRDNGTFGFWGWDPDSAIYDPPLHLAFLQWPLPEDFSYSASITSNDGYHVGSLVYYPSELEDYYDGLTNIEPAMNNNIPTEFSLRQNYPNPFNPTTAVEFVLAKNGSTNLVIYNALGQTVKTILDNKEMSAGSYTVDIDMSVHASGIYFYVLEQHNNRQVQKMVLMK